jgi:hypothetical protein
MLFGAAVLGAAGMYFSDPERGRRRRALARDQARHFGTTAVRAADIAARDLSNRLAGMSARTRKMFQRQNASADDRVVAERVRAALGRAVSHPHAIEVAAQQGRIVLRGPILAQETDGLLAAVHAVPGVTGVEDQLDVHMRAEHVPSLQGGGGRRRTHSGFMQDDWTPALRGIAVVGGGAASAYGLARRTPAGLALAAIGLAFSLRGLANRSVRRVAGIKSGHRAVGAHKTADVMEPRETVKSVTAASYGPP